MLKDKDTVTLSDIFITVSSLQDVLLAFVNGFPPGFTDLNGKTISDKEIFGSLAKAICEDIVSYVDKSLNGDANNERCLCLDK